MSQAKFSAETTNVKIIFNVLKSIAFNEFAIFYPMEQGLKITVEGMKRYETSVYLPANIFNSYNIRANEGFKFKISLKVFTECLHIFGDEGTPTLKLSYLDDSSPLSLVMKHSEENIVVDGELSTMSVEDFHEVQLSEECNGNRIVFQGEQLVNNLSDLDNQADDFELEITKQCFRILTTSIMGESKLEIFKNCEIVNIFEYKGDFKERYTFKNLKQALKVMTYADKVAISTGESGLLGIQLTITAVDRQLYVEYYMTSLFDTD